MNISEEMAIRLHRMMWSDMQKELGDNPGPDQRVRFKEDWIDRMFPDEDIENGCWLCQYTATNESDNIVKCSRCPIKWPMGHCNTRTLSYLRTPISKILALPARNEKLTGLEAKYIANDKETVAICYYQYREQLLSKASGIPATLSIEDHIKAIQEKAVGEKTESIIDDFLCRCEKYPDTPIDEQLKKRMCAIKEKAVEEYFEKQPAAKMVSMDVDNAFRQYAEEQKAPIFKELSKASGLSECDHNVLDHINWIKLKGEQDIHRALKEKNASIFRALAEESGLDPTATVKAHINAIYSNGFDDGKDAERERIMDKIGEMLKK